MSTEPEDFESTFDSRSGAPGRDGRESAGDDRIDDATVVVNDATVAVNDATVVVNDATVAVNDATIVVNDSTVVVTQADRADDQLGQRPMTVSGSASASTHLSHSASQSASVGLPVEEPLAERSLPDSLRSGAGLDPDRRIAQMPGMLPWEVLPGGEQGVSQDLPVAYGARAAAAFDLQLGADEVQRRIGPAPVGEPIQVRPGREQLPSLNQHDRRRKTVTLALYAGAIVVCVAGLIGVATLAFG